jgi:hypothetical protein
MEKLQKLFSYDELLKIQRPLLGENYVLNVRKYPSLKEFKVVHQEVSMMETPLALARKVFLSHTEKSETALQLDMTLCWHGFRDALRLLFAFTKSFERSIPTEAVYNTAQKHEIGDFGLAWSWIGRDEPNILCFLRNNVLVSIQGYNLEGLIVTIAGEIDGELKALRTTKEYAEAKAGVFSEIKRKQTPRVIAGGRLTIGTYPIEKENLFFLTTSGSVNRDIDRPDVWYYRAGIEKGEQEIIVFRVDSGILPKMERLIIEVT